MKREQIEIMAQILAFCIQTKRKTHIMYQNNLSHAQLKTYLTLLTSKKLLAHNSDSYMTTDTGHRFLKAFAQLNDVLGDPCTRASIETIHESHEKVRWRLGIPTSTSIRHSTKQVRSKARYEERSHPQQQQWGAKFGRLGGCTFFLHLLSLSSRQAPPSPISVNDLKWLSAFGGLE